LLKHTSITLTRAVVILASICAGFSFTPAAANPQLALVPGARANMDMRPSERVQSALFDYEHAITIALPASYAVQPERSYPVLWVLDDPLMTRMAVGTVDLLVAGNKMPEVIVIGVGSPSEEGLAGVSRRIMEFSPPGAGFAAPGLAGEAFRKVAPLPDYPHRADDFLAFLVDELRPELAQRLRFSGEHILYGHSLGGMFGGYALFKRPDAFDKMILGSPAMANVDDAVFKAEEDFAGNNRNLPVSLYVGAGGGEPDEWFLSVGNILSGTARFVERLQLRGYEGLELESEFYTAEDHYTVAPRVLLDGLSHLYRSEAEEIGSSWPQRP
jgi:predicted alpha/beta superfamily hydrolase